MFKTGVVILNYKNFKMTEDCVECLLELGAARSNCGVDNDSQNESVAYLSSRFENNAQIDIIANSRNAGYAAGNNVGLRYLIRTTAMCRMSAL